MTTDQLERQLDRVHEWIRSLDIKISILAVLEVALVTTLATSYKGSLVHIMNENLYFNFLLHVVGGLLLFVGIYFLVKGLFPKINNTSEKFSLTFFGDIAKIKPTNFKESILSANEQDLKLDFIQQIHVSASVASKKHVYFQKSITFFGAGFILLFASTLILWFI